MGSRYRVPDDLATWMQTVEKRMEQNEALALEGKALAKKAAAVAAEANHKADDVAHAIRRRSRST